MRHRLHAPAILQTVMLYSGQPSCTTTVALERVHVRCRMHVNMYDCAEQALNMARSASFKLALAAAAVLLIAGVAAQVRLALAAPPLCAIEIVHVPQGFAGIQMHVRPAAQRRYCDHPQPSVKT